MGCITKRPATWGNFSSCSFAINVHKNDNRSDIGYCSLILSAPSNLIVSNPLTAEGIERVDALQLDWDSQSGGQETGFGIERSVDGIIFIEIDTVGTDVLTYTNDSLTYNETWFYRVRALGINPSGYSEIYSDTVATNPLIFGSNLHGMYTSDHLLFNGLRISSYKDLSGNGRYINQPITSEQPYFAPNESMQDSLIDGHPTIAYFKNTGDNNYIENLSNWVGIGTDQYFVIMMSLSDTITGNNRVEFNRVDAADDGVLTSAHQLIRASNPRDGLYGAIPFLTPRIVDTTTVKNEFSFDVYCMGADIEGAWNNGVLNGNTVIRDQSDGNYFPESFDSIRFGNTKNLGGSSNGQRVVEFSFIKGKPSDFPDLFNDIHTIYGVNRYPSRNIQNPNI